MAENTKRSVFGFHGIFGVLISIVGLLSILFTLMYYAVGAQRNATERPYDPAPIRNVNNLKKISVDNKQFSFVEAKNKDK
jgi:hypothetical protein